MELAAVVVDVKQDLASSWKATRMLEQGMQHHHTASCSVQMTKYNGEKAKTDKESAEVFANHFSKAFNNPDPLPCDASVLPLILTQPQFSELAAPPDLEEVMDAIMRMANGKAPGPSGVTSDAFCAMFWCEPDPQKEGLNKDAEFLCNYVTET
eukprot:5893080-Ditylum_brightwellii.AAC.1